MVQFFKIFFASLLSLFAFFFLSLFLIFALAGSLASKEKPEIAQNSLLVLDLSQAFPEQRQEEPLSKLTLEGPEAPGLYEAVRLIKAAKEDKRIAGIHIIANGNANSFASSNEIRNALLDFKTSGKPMMAHGDVMSQGAYFVANAARKLYLNPVGDLDWRGYNVEFIFFKNLLDKLQIQPQVFFAGKFKSATEPFRTTQMTPENKLQTSEWLGDLYRHFLVTTAAARRVDTATLHRLASGAAIQKPDDAVRYGLVDGLRYDDQVKSEWKKLLKLTESARINFVSIGKYDDAADYKRTGKDRIAVVYAAGNIVDGDGGNNAIGGERFVALFRKLRMDRTVKAIVLRINSGGGSALASENMWRELDLAKKEKPLVVSFGDVAASGGYYMACGADSIFAHPNTITGSIGVFTLIPNMQGFFNNKLGITFDGVKTADGADATTVYKPMSEKEKEITQAGVDRIYSQFKDRVAKGRRRPVAYIDSIAQGRVWSGAKALNIGLVDKMGSLQDAVDCAARMAKTTNYRLREFPEQKSWLDKILKRQTEEKPAAAIREQVGAANYEVFQQLVQIQSWCNGAQARLPFSFIVK